MSYHYCLRIVDAPGGAHSSAEHQKCVLVLLFFTEISTFYSHLYIHHIRLSHFAFQDRRPPNDEETPSTHLDHLNAQPPPHRPLHHIPQRPHLPISLTISTTTPIPTETAHHHTTNDALQTPLQVLHHPSHLQPQASSKPPPANSHPRNPQQSLSPPFYSLPHTHRTTT